MIGISRKELMGLSPPRGKWVVCIIKSTGQPFIGRVIDDIEDDNGAFLYISIPVLNCEITSETHNWEIVK